MVSQDVRRPEGTPLHYEESVRVNEAALDRNFRLIEGLERRAMFIVAVDVLLMAFVFGSVRGAWPYVLLVVPALVSLLCCYQVFGDRSHSEPSSTDFIGGFGTSAPMASELRGRAGTLTEEAYHHELVEACHRNMTQARTKCEQTRLATLWLAVAIVVAFVGLALAANWAPANVPTNFPILPNR